MKASTRQTLMISGVLGVIGAVIVAGVMTQSSNTANTSEAQLNHAAPVARPTPPVDAGEAGRRGLSDLVQAGAKARIVSTDTAGNTVLEAAFDTIEPLPDGRFSATGIDGWGRLGDGRIQVQAPRGTLVMPGANEAPESGTLSGGVTIRLLEPDPTTNTMLVTVSVQVPTLEFDFPAGELSTNDPLKVLGVNWAADLQGLFVQFSEVRQRVQYARVANGGLVQLGPEHGLSTSAQHAAPTQTPATRPTTTASTDAPSKSPREPRIDHYRLQAAGSVRAKSSNYAINADSLQIFARLTDGSLNAGPAEQPANTAAQNPASNTSSDRDAPSTRDTITGTFAWNHTLELQALDAAPIELVRDDLIARFMPASNNRVRLADTESGIEATAAGFEYAATRQAARLIGIPDQRAVAIAVPGVGNASLSDLIVDFTTGRGSATGPGSLQAQRAADDRAPDRIDWNTGLTFQLQGVARNTAESLWLERADFTGSVQASDSHRILRGHLVRAWFDRAEATSNNAQAANDTSAMRLQRVTATGDGETPAVALAPRRDVPGSFDRIAAMELTVLFEPAAAGSNSVVPTLASAVGQVQGQWEGNTVQGGYAEAHFTQPTTSTPAASASVADNITVHRVEVEAAEGEQIVLQSADGWHASGRRATTTQGTDIATIVGSPATVVFMDQQGGQSLTGPSIELRQADRIISVNGPGTASLATKDQRAMAYSRVQVSWHDALHYDDRAGRAEAIGRVVAVGTSEDNTQGVSERHLGEGQRAVLRITPGTTDHDAQSTQPTPAERRLLAVELTGDPDSAEEAQWARAEFQRFRQSSASEGDASLSASPADRQLDFLIELAGKVLRSNLQEGTLDVPGPGRLVIEDRRRTSSDQRASVGGLSRFRWEGGLALDAAEGRSTMSDRVSLLHRPPGSTTNTEMRCQRLDAWFIDELGRPLSQSHTASSTDLVQGLGSAGAQLDRVELRGAVWMTHEAVEVSGDTLRYKTSDDELFIAANDGNTVTIVERASGRTFNAREVAVNLRTGAWRRSGGGIVQ